MTQTKTETVTGFIEKLEALPRWDKYRNRDPRGGFVNYDDLSTIIEQAKAECGAPKNSTSIEALISDFDKDPLVNKSLDYSRSRLKDFLSSKAEQAEPVAWRYRNTQKGSFHYMTSHPVGSEEDVIPYDVVPLYIAPQPTSQDVIDAERWRKLRSLICNGMSGIGVTYFAGTDFHTVQDAEMLDSVIDQAMKGA